ncbi:MAG TPA: outer membrane protein assembly factor BamD [Verrucomicrobiae bacterium]|nr:outer membrane protein assembly factor BamD [Verrucomicrobiae bacterium]
MGISFCKKLVVTLLAIMTFAFLMPVRSPAPLIWRKGEGWTWEHAGVKMGTNPVDQLKIAQGLQAKKQFRSAIDAYRRVIGRWPQSSSTQDARFGLAECLSAIGYHYQAFKEYQQLIEKHPNSPHFDAVLQRQFEIGDLFLAGERQKAWGVRWFPSLERTIEIFEKVVKNGPYSSVAADAQFRIGLAYEKEKDYLAAVHAYEKVLERYAKSSLAETAQFQIGCAYKMESQRSEYDQNAANQAIAAFDDFLLRYPESDKVPLAQKYQIALKEEQAKGLFDIGKFYEKGKEYKAALIYYNDVIEKNPNSDWATQAKDKVAKLTPLTAEKTATP